MPLQAFPFTNKCEMVLVLITTALLLWSDNYYYEDSFIVSVQTVLWVNKCESFPFDYTTLLFYL